jgi:putative ribosome biogenesis GTPase RsgA
MIKEARRKNNIKMKYYNIAIIGQSGVGKSTIVNGIRGLYPNGKDAAKEGDLEETTQ